MNFQLVFQHRMLLQAFYQISVQLDHGQLVYGTGHRFGQGRQTRADFDHDMLIIRGDSRHNTVDHIVIGQEVLSETFSGGMA